MHPIRIDGNHFDLSAYRVPRSTCLHSVWFDVDHLGDEEIHVCHLSCEPRTFRMDVERVIANQSRFQLILTGDEEILARCANARLFPYGVTWLDPEDVLLARKRFGVSFLCGHKRYTPGHQLRQELWARQREITSVRRFWISGLGREETRRHELTDGTPEIEGNPILPAARGEKWRLFEEQFHIAIENEREQNYFSEKLVDCFMSRTVPIYWGCPNIERFFDTRGMILVDSLDDLVRAASSVTPETYDRLFPYVEHNYHLCRQYVPYERRLFDAISTAM